VPTFDLHFLTTAKRLSKAAPSKIIWDLHQAIVSPASSSDEVKAAKGWLRRVLAKPGELPRITVPPLAALELRARRKPQRHEFALGEARRTVRKSPARGP
jgi:hypothetical protein